MASNDSFHMYIYDLPYSERKTLCRILDMNDTWEELGGIHMKFDVGTLQRVSQAVLRNHSPTDELLSLWGTQNHTVLELFVLLSRMQHYQAMMVLKPLVQPKYHRLIYEGEENFSSVLLAEKEEIVTEDTPPNTNATSEKRVTEKKLGFEDVNFNLKCPQQANGKRLLLERPSTSQVDEGKILNSPSPTKESSERLPTIKKVTSTTGDSSVPGEGLSPMITYQELEIATGSWDRRNLLGKGGFGTVYKGTWKNTQVAIKRLEVQKGGDAEEIWKTQREQSLRELKCLNSCRHDNILPLYGYSIGGPHDCLVYQYMPNGSLEDRLLCREGTKPLIWSQRHNIATGTARGLQFLHTFGEKPLVHGDIKSANILLDPHLEPKIGDFGLAREGPLQQYTHVKVSRVHGTRPYLPDEFLRAKKFSTKVDTYSFGIVLFELATGLRAYDDSRAYKFLKDQVEALGSDRINEVRDMKAGVDDGLFNAMIALGKCCISQRAKDRPEMVLVLQKLDSMACTREMVHGQFLVRHNSLTPVSPYELQFVHDHLSQQRRLSLPPRTFQGGCMLTPNSPPIPYPLVANSHSNPRSNPLFQSNTRSNSPFVLSNNAPMNSLHIALPVAQFANPHVRSISPYEQQNPPGSNLVSPAIKVQPPSAPNLSDLLPQTLNQGGSDGCDLPLISELGIKSVNIDEESGSTN